MVWDLDGVQVRHRTANNMQTAIVDKLTGLNQVGLHFDGLESQQEILNTIQLLPDFGSITRSPPRPWWSSSQSPNRPGQNKTCWYLHAKSPNAFTNQIPTTQFYSNWIQLSWTNMLSEASNEGNPEIVSDFKQTVKKYAQGRPPEHVSAFLTVSLDIMLQICHHFILNVSLYHLLSLFIIFHLSPLLVIFHHHCWSFIIIPTHSPPRCPARNGGCRGSWVAHHSK